MKGNFMQKKNNIFLGCLLLLPAVIPADGFITPIARIIYEGDSAVVKFSWLVTAPGQGKSQSAYRIMVSSTRANSGEFTGDMWDSGRISGQNNYDITYAGRPLAAGTEYFWCVEVWDERNASLGTSAVSTFETVLATESDWGGARWLRGTANPPSSMFRKQFTVDGSVERARIFISGLGLYLVTVNGQPVDGSVLNSSVTQYNKTIPYGMHDIKDLLRQGENVIGVELGDGPFSDRGGFVNFFYHFRGGWDGTGSWAPWLTPADDTQRLLLRMDINYSNRPTQTIVSDDTWRFSDSGPITRNEFWEGETYDARREMPGWDSPGFTEGWQWRNAAYTSAPAGAALRYSYVDPMEKVQSYEPESITRLSDGSWVIAAPEMMSGWMSLRLNTRRGAQIVIQYGEMLNETAGRENRTRYLAGSVKPTIDRGFGTRTVLQQDVYIAKGEPGEVYEPRFRYSGFQFVQINGYRGEITKDDITFYRVNNAVRTTSGFSTSSSYLNQLHHMMRMTLLSNFHGRPTDTPVFEKQGYGGDVIAVLPSMTFNFDVSRFLLHYHDALRDTQGQDGEILNRAPGNDSHQPDGATLDPAWGSVYIFIADTLANKYGMQNIIAERYDSMKALADWYIQQSRDRFNWTWAGNRFGDWLAPGDINNPDSTSGSPEGSQITGAAYVYFALQKMEQFARQLGKTADAAHFRDAMDNIANAFNTNLWNETLGFYRVSSQSSGRFRQTSNYLPLAMGIVPADRKERVVQNILNDMERIFYRIDTGFLGAALILPFLSDYGSDNAAFKVLNNTNFPSWGYWIANGATSLWEEFPLHTRSRNHFFWGSYDNWFHEYLAGVRDIRDGYRTFTLKPAITDRLSWVRLELDTVRGKLISHWERSGGVITYTAVVPFGSTAAIYLPADGGRTYTVNEGAVYKGTENGFAVYEAGSGNYIFREGR